MNPDHQLYGKADSTAPASIKDSNGVVVLGLCKLCGKGEAELDGPCIDVQEQDRVHTKRPPPEIIHLCSPKGQEITALALGERSSPQDLSAAKQVVDKLVIDADATKIHRMDMMVGDLKVFFEWHPKTGDKDIHTIVLVPEYEIRIELAGNWHAPIYVEQAIMVYLQAMGRQLLSSNPLSAFKLGELHGIIFSGKARQKAKQP